ncbi:MAG: zf-HC2 domain-containing protein [Acidimicrobiia bacterium]|nr:zf-HC2 domain-containing protein [Acidimicrobiia bacterium]
MIPVVGCESARPFLADLLDDELGVEEQVMVEAHLRSCRTCAAHLEDLKLIGASLRNVAVRTPWGTVDVDGLAMAVLGRTCAEREASWPVRARRLLEDRHVMWAGAGATVGMLACVLLTLGVVTATDRRSGDSLAAVIDALGAPGSDRNPVALTYHVSPPRLAIPDYYDDAPELTRIPKNDAVFAFAATVTREGRIAGYELLRSHYPAEDGGGRMVSLPPPPTELSFLESAVSTVRFSPAQLGGSPVAVNLVWLVARTTVKGSPRPFDFDVKPPEPGLAGRRSS